MRRDEYCKAFLCIIEEDSTKRHEKDTIQGSVQVFYPESYFYEIIVIFVNFIVIFVNLLLIL